jgi:hypothetical protein
MYYVQYVFTTLKKLIAEVPKLTKYMFLHDGSGITVISDERTTSN